MKKSTFALALAIASSAPAAAQDGSPPTVSAPDGFRIEGLAGYDTDGFKGGALYGLRIGYDRQVSPSLLIGIDAEVNDVTITQKFSFHGQPTIVLQDGPDLYAGARATVILSPRFRLHGGLGYTRLRDSQFMLANPTQTLESDSLTFAHILSAEGSWRTHGAGSDGGWFSARRRWRRTIVERHGEAAP